MAIEKGRGLGRGGTRQIHYWRLLDDGKRTRRGVFCGL